MASSQCERCERWSTEENTICSHKRPGKDLPFHSASVCTPCHNWAQKEMRGRVVQLKKHLAVPGNRSRYKQKVNDYERNYRDSNPINGEKTITTVRGRNYAVNFSSIEVQDAHQVLLDKDCGALWSVSAYIGLNGPGEGKTKDDPAIKSQIIKFQDGDGQWFDGILDLTGHRTIAGVMRVTKRYSRSVIKVDEIGNN